MIIKTQQELENLINNNNEIIVDDDLEIHCDININANIRCKKLSMVETFSSDVKGINTNNNNPNIELNAVLHETTFNVCSIRCFKLEADDIEAWSIIARDIFVNNGINAHYLIADNIDCVGVIVWNSLFCGDIKAEYIHASSINIKNIKSGIIKYIGEYHKNKFSKYCNGLLT